MAELTKINPKDKVKVTNMSRGSLSYYSESFHKKRRWEGPVKGRNSYHLIPIEEIDDIMQTRGGASLFHDGLQIDNPDVREYLGLNNRTLVELSMGKIKTMLGNQTKIDVFDNFVKSLPTALRDRVVQEAIESEILDFDKADVLKYYSGVDIIQAIALKRELKAEAAKKD